ncbi:hypothetical protein [Bradyrhizobium commune]|uniref:Uncharacterized protein n=1 Tax=Bradyrhizobium commune TaxID=83627 RepID=A0A7S9H094_9BRAD|nr:hypothetical protein [Bradyrhizobium commune]QPF91480.1 hypothetical protein IC761_34435 [Bradyrhizobium commune]
MDFLDDLMSPGGDGLGEEANAATAGGSLVVPEKAPDGSFLMVEEQAFLATGALGYLVMFAQPDEVTGEDTLSNGREFADAAGWLSLPDEQEALDWLNQRLGASFETWRPRLAEAWALALSNLEFTAKPDPATVPRWARAPHSTGKLGRGHK